MAAEREEAPPARGGGLPRGRFEDRVHAGRYLAARLADLASDPSVVVLGLPRGGVPVAAEVAKALGAPLDVALVRKLGVPGREEYAMGAIAAGGVVELDRGVIERLALSDADVQAVVARERAELQRRTHLYRGQRLPVPLTGRTVVLVDDGLATGATMRAALAAVRRELPRRVIVAAPVGASETCRALADEAEACVCALEPPGFRSVGEWYDDFAPTDDDEVIACLSEPRRARRVD